MIRFMEASQKRYVSYYIIKNNFNDHHLQRSVSPSIASLGPTNACHLPLLYEARQRKVEPLNVQRQPYLHKSMSKPEKSSFGPQFCDGICESQYEI